MKRHLASAIALALTMTVAGAHADSTATAEDLFQRAKTLIASGRWSEACPLLAESYRLDPAGGTLQNLAVCYESSGKWASAFARFQELKSIAKSMNPPRADRIKFADEHLAKVTPKVSHVALVIPDDLAASAVTVIDGETYQRVSWSAGIAIDPGPHEVVVTAAGRKPFKTSITIPAEATEQKLQVPELEKLPVEMTDLSNDRNTKDEKAERAEAERRTRRMGFFVAGGGVVLLAAGGVFGGLAISKNNDGKDLCHKGPNANAGADFDPATGVCYTPSTPLDQANRAKSLASAYATISTVTTIVGAVAVAGGLYIALVRAKSTASLRIGPTVGGAFAEGTF